MRLAPDREALILGGNIRRLLSGIAATPGLSELTTIKRGAQIGAQIRATAPSLERLMDCELAPTAQFEREP